MNDVHRPLSLAMSPGTGSSGGSAHDDTSSLQGNIDAVSASESGAGPSRARGYVYLRDDGSIGMNVPSYPRDCEALISPCAAPSTSDDAATSSDPPPFPSLAPYKDVRPVPWAYLKLLLATELVNIRRENKNALSSVEAQARLLQNIVAYIRDGLHVHLPCFGSKTIQQLQQILELDPAFRDAMQRLETDGELAMRTIVHHLLSRPVPASSARAVSVASRPDAAPVASKASEDSHPLQAAGSCPELDGCDASLNHDRSVAATLPSFKPRLYKGRVEGNTAHWTNLVWTSGQTCRQIPSAVPSIEELGQVVHAIVSRITVDSPGAASLFEGISPAQFAALLACDPAFESAVRDLQTKASNPDYLAYCQALRLVVNHLCQNRKGAHNAVRHVQISSPSSE